MRATATIFINGRAEERAAEADSRYPEGIKPVANAGEVISYVAGHWYAQPVACCPHCLAAAERVYARFDNQCRGCRARRVARSNEFHNASQATPDQHDFDKVRDKYRSLLNVANVSHQEVRAAKEADYVNKESA